MRRINTKISKILCSLSVLLLASTSAHAAKVEDPCTKFYSYCGNSSPNIINYNVPIGYAEVYGNYGSDTISFMGYNNVTQHAKLAGGMGNDIMTYRGSEGAGAIMLGEDGNDHLISTVRQNAGGGGVAGTAHLSTIVLDGGFGNDELEVEPGNVSILFGREGDDDLYETNRLIGQAGGVNAPVNTGLDTQMTGGLGSDDFAWSVSYAHNPAPGQYAPALGDLGTDVVYDFNKAEDKLFLYCTIFINGATQSCWPTTVTSANFASVLSLTQYTPASAGSTAAVGTKLRIVAAPINGEIQFPGIVPQDIFDAFLNGKVVFIGGNL